MFTVTNRQGNVYQNLNDIHLTPGRMARIKKTVFCKVKVLNLMKAKLSIFLYFLACALGIISKNSLSVPNLGRISSMF